MEQQQLPPPGSAKGWESGLLLKKRSFELRQPLSHVGVPNGHSKPSPTTNNSASWTQTPPLARAPVPQDESPLNFNYFSTLPPSPPVHRTGPFDTNSVDSTHPLPSSVELIGGALQRAIGCNNQEPPRCDSSLHSQSNESFRYAPAVLLSPPWVVPSPNLGIVGNKIRKRPSQIIPPAHGLAMDTGDDGLPAPSPRLRRFYPLDPSTASPLPSPDASHFTPIPSPASGYLSPGLPSPTGSLASSHMNSPNHGESRNSPLSVLADPISRLAAGISQRTRRSSNSSPRTDLPTSRSPSPRLDGASPKGSIRSTSYTKSQRSKKERSPMLESEGRHGLFGWAKSESAILGREERVSRRWKGIIAGIVTLAVLSIVIYQSQTSPRAAPVRSRVINPAPKLRRGNVGHLFIHPDVLDPLHRRESTQSYLLSPYRWLSNLLVFEKNSKSHGSARDGTITRSRSTGDMATLPIRAVQKKQNHFVAAPPVAFVKHHALPPPLVHADAPERDTLVLYRILGNDLPPRHSPGQTLRNLRFLLQYESDFSTLTHVGPHPVHHSHIYGSGSSARQHNSEDGGLRVDKYFVLNRIANPDMSTAILGLLRLYSVPDSRILVIPFEWEEYQKREFRWDGGVDKLACWGIGAGEAEPVVVGAPSFALGKNSMRHHAIHHQGSHAAVDDPLSYDPVNAAKRAKKKASLASLRALDFMYHEKNLYAMNNNGGRNFALEHGRSLPHARWILPLDGNSFLTPAAMDSVVKTLAISGEGPSASRYLVIPMARLLANEDVLANNSIALVSTHTHDGRSATSDAEIYHSSDAAPVALEEPQVGFRFDATESYQPAMRYGRRSKLELLWRLGAIPYSRGLDRRTFPWEFSDRAHVTESTWGSIPGVASLSSDSAVHRPHAHQPHVDFKPWIASSPERDAFAYSKAGWVYRLFSGDKSQEEVSPEAVTLRNTNRIKGIVAFLEALDEKVARGAGDCTEPGGCGFRPERLWSFDEDALERLRQKYKLGISNTLEKVDAFERDAMITLENVRNILEDSTELDNAEPQDSATNAALLAVAGYVTGNATYSAAGTELIDAKFIKSTPLYYRQSDQRAQMTRYQNQNQKGFTPKEEDGVGYAFPTPPVKSGSELTWASPTTEAGPALPFNPLEFDPTLLLDAFRILAMSNSPQSHSETISRKSINLIFVAQLSYLLFSPDAVALSRNPPSSDVGAHYDSRVASLAAFLDEAVLIGRVANRGRLRLHRASRTSGVMHNIDDVREVHFRLLRGLAMIKFRPYNLISTDVASLGIGDPTPFSILGL